jgi:hypothetical protein
MTMAMILFQKKPSSLPDLIRQSIPLRKIHFFKMDARVTWREDGASRLLPAHDGVCLS